ncbi:MAG TPA: type II toxin-antitoxin system MqsA family antitoxin [Polyangiaceae bacterium]|nr:type II toxin-antitoxin system MqsA family antitoxin [Polyangiaceae bacterium]
MRCHNCGGESFEKRTVDNLTRVGDHAVLDRSVRRPVCKKCGEYTISADTLETLELRAAVCAFEKADKVTGGMLRFARKALDLTQGELAARLGTTAESVSRWEREERPMEPWVELAVTSLIRERLSPLPTDLEFKQAG